MDCTNFGTLDNLDRYAQRYVSNTEQFARVSLVGENHFDPFEPNPHFREHRFRGERGFVYDDFQQKAERVRDDVALPLVHRLGAAL